MSIKKLPFLALIALLAVACGEESEDTIQFDTFTANKEVTLSNDEGSPMCAVHLQVVFAVPDNGHKAEVVNNIIQKRLLNMEDINITHAVDSFCNSYTATYLRNLLPLYNQDRADSTKRSWYEYHYIITSEAFQGCSATDIRPASSVVSAIVDYFEGGAHGLNQQLTMNFNNKTGQLIELTDIFVPGYESQLVAELQKALREKTGAENLSKLRSQGYLVSMEMYPSENYIINDETITFIYNPDEIAPYDKGSTELTISLSDLKKILKPEYMP
jgi:hypothetical protein